MSVNQIMQESWVDVLELLGHPNLKEPRIIDGSDTAYINMDTKEICVYDGFINRTKLPLDVFFKGVLAHEANHYVTLPYDLKTNILLNYEASKASKANANALSNYFSDAVINLDLVDRGVVEISDIYKDMNSKSMVTKTVSALYNNQTGLDFGDITGVDKRRVRKLAKLDYKNLELDSLRQNCFHFALILSDLEIEDEPPGVMYEPGSNPQVLDDIVKEISPGELHAFNNGLNSKLDLIDYYQRLSEYYGLNIKKVPNISYTKSTAYSDWEVGIPIHQIDFLKSKGKIIPGITKYKHITKTGSEEREDGLPNATIIIDSSGSMIPPHHEVSPAVVSAFCIANNYLDKGKKVGVANFSSSTSISGYLADRDKVCKRILDYQCGGTDLDLVKLNKFIDKESDIYVLSDMFIEDLTKVVNYFNNKSNRTSFFHIDPMQKLTNLGKINYYPITNLAQLPDLVINEVNNRNGV